MHRRTWWTVAGAAVLAGTAACTDALTPREIIGRWEGDVGNGAAIPGDVPLWSGLVLDTVHFVYSRFQLSTVTECSYAVAINAASNGTVNESCTYDVDRATGAIAITLNGSYVIAGTLTPTSMELTWPNTDGPANVFEYTKE